MSIGVFLDDISLVSTENDCLQIKKERVVSEPSFEYLGHLGKDRKGSKVFLAYNKITKVAYYYFVDSDTYLPIQSADGRMYEYDEEHGCLHHPMRNLPTFG